MPAKTLMIQGSMSSVGKSMLVTALCRIFARKGIRVAPFKAQNMSNNAGVTSTGGEIGRSQHTQALACGIEPTVQMNPVLLKPEADMRSQVIVNGKIWESLPAIDYYQRKAFLWEQVTSALDSLRDEYDLIIIEGAGSPAELNLKQGDIVNMAVAQYAQSPVLLAGDIDRGGVFAQLLGTMMLLDPDEHQLIKGFIVNKFRGDPRLFEDGITILQDRSHVPVLGVIPYIHQHGIPEEDAVAIEPQNRIASPIEAIDIAVIALPRIANFDDFDPLQAEHGVTIRYISDVSEFGTPDAVILPGTKSTIADYQWLQASGLAEKIQQYAVDGGAVVGICGGYQMLGQTIRNPQHIESDTDYLETLGLLSTETLFLSEKSTYQIQATIRSHIDWLKPLRGSRISGYEIHMGQTQSSSSWLSIQQRNHQDVTLSDGAINTEGRIWGCYIHGLFHNRDFRRAWLTSLGWQITEIPNISLDNAFDRLADRVEAHLDINTLQQIIGF
jgi:adenosylcobyric acid synthase